MSVIKKLQETSASGSITTLFRLGSVAAISAVPKRPPFHSPQVTGFGWCLTIRKKGKKIQLCFNSHSCPDVWCGTLAKVTISFPSHPDVDMSLTASIAVILGFSGFDANDNHPLITCPAEKLGNAIVSLEVTLTKTLTCMPFTVPAPVRPVPDAPTSAEAPRASQTCSALRVLEQSLKTGTSFDIVFQAYTRRLSLGKVARPIPVYASTAVLQTTLPDFCTLYFYPYHGMAAEYRWQPEETLIRSPSLNCLKATLSLSLPWRVMNMILTVTWMTMISS